MNHTETLTTDVRRRRILGSGAALGSMVLLGGLTPPAFGADSAPAAVADFWDVIRRRRSVRRFRPDAVPEADIRTMIDVARLAPTSGNQQPWKFLVIRDPAKIAAMKEACVQRILARADGSEDKTTSREQRESKTRDRFAGYFSAPVYIVVLTDNKSTYPDYNHWDGPLAAGYLMLAARALGYGTVFITDVIPDSVTREVLHIPDTYTRVCITPVGVPAGWPESPEKKKLAEFIAFEAL